MNGNKKSLVEHTKDNELKLMWDANNKLFNAPTVVYINIPKKRTQYCLFDSGAIEMAIMLAAKDHGIDSVAAYHSI